MFSSANFNPDLLERKRRIRLPVFIFLGMLLVYMWVTSSEGVNLCVVRVADDVSAVCVSAPLQCVRSLGFGWTCKKDQKQPQLSVQDGRHCLGPRLHQICLQRKKSPSSQDSAAPQYCLLSYCVHPAGTVSVHTERHPNKNDPVEVTERKSTSPVTFLQNQDELQGKRN